MLISLVSLPIVWDWIACELITMFSLSPMVLLQHARVFLGGFLESRNYKIQVVAQAARQMFSEGCHEEEERQMRKSYGHREESVIWHKCKCGLPTIVGSVAWELLQPARIRRGAWHHQSGGRGKMGRVWVVVSTLPPTRTDVGVWNLETKNVVNRHWWSCISKPNLSIDQSH